MVLSPPPRLDRIVRFEPWYGIEFVKADIPDPRYPEHYPQVATEDRISCQAAFYAAGDRCRTDTRGQRFICGETPTIDECLLEECQCEDKGKGLEYCTFVTVASGYPCDGVE